MRLHHSTTEFNCGIDLHSRNMYICVMDKEGNILLHRNVRGNDFSFFLKLVEAYRHDLTVACESTFNWYWLSDACYDAGIHFVLGHALYMKALHGTKTKNDKVDSRKIADLLRGNLLPLAYCCSAERRPARDLLRRRIWLARLGATVKGRISANVQAHGQVAPTRQELRDAARQGQAPQRFDNPLLQLGLDSDASVRDFLDAEVMRLETAILRQTRLTASAEYSVLKSVPGFGRLLPLIVLYEADDINRFPTVRNFCSYSLLAPADSTSGGKIVGTQGRQLGNHYLKWAFTQATVIAKRTGPIKQYADRLTAKHGKRHANRIIAHRLAIATYHMLQAKTPFDYKKFLNGKVNVA